MTENEYEDRRYQRVILLDPPPTPQNLTCALPDGTTFRPMELMVCPVCRGDYLLGKAKTLRTKYLEMERIVGVCPTCADKPPRDYRRKLRVALKSFPWSGEGEGDSTVECDSENTSESRGVDENR